MGLVKENTVIHVKHFKDGYPLCWDMDQTGTFEGSWNDAEVTCPKCIKHLQE